MKTLLIGAAAFAALFFLAALMVAHADEVMVYKLTLDHVKGKVAIYNPYEDYFTLDECNHKSAELTIALNLSSPPSCVPQTAIRQQG